MRNFAILFIFFSILVSAQTKGIVVDENNKPISYVNIWVENENVGTTSEENGKFTINIEDKNKVLIFSALGFETKKVTIAEADKVVLKVVPFSIDEVVITKRKAKVEIEIGNYKKGGINLFYGASNLPRIVAKYFPITKEIEKTLFLKELTINTSCRNLNEAKMNLHFYEVNEDGSPGNDISEKMIVLKVKKGHRDTTINLEEYNIQFQEKGLFVGVEWLIIDENKTELEITDSKSKEKTKMVYYEPSVGIVPSTTPENWEYQKGKWNNRKWKNGQNLGKNYEDKFEQLAIKLTLTN